MRQTALLALQDGSLFYGRSIGIAGQSVGEVVFNTSITGYQEILTDPSYYKQIVTLTYPHIGNVGTNAEDEESSRVYAAGLVIRDLPLLESNWRSQEPLEDYLRRQQVVGIADIDTRRLTRLLREKGAQAGCLVTGEALDPAAAIAVARGFGGLKGLDLAKEVTVHQSYQWKDGLLSTVPPITPRWKVFAYDFGVKRAILRRLVEQGCQVTVVPAQTPASELLAQQPDGIFLSNGPGDPEPCQYAITAIQQIVEARIPTFGICLGHQLLGLASGARTLKMKFGHHGANHPVQDCRTGQVLITSQNHGFTIDDAHLPTHLQVTHRSLFDGTIQGIQHQHYPAFSFQGHPEASPGPHDITSLFKQFVTLMENNSQTNQG